MLLALFATIAVQDVREDVVEELADGGRLEYQVVHAADGSTLRDGEFRRETAEGDKIVQGKYEGGARTGRWRFWHPNGEPWALGRFKRDRRSGEWTFHDAEGESVAQGDYADGELSGHWEFTGVWAGESGDYEPVVATWGGLGIEVRGARLDGRPHGPWSASWPDGTPLFAGWFDRGRRAGTWTFQHADGSYDPEFLSGELSSPPLPRVVSEDPHAVAATGAQGEPTQGPLDPNALPDLSDPRDESHEVMARWLAADEAARTPAQDVFLGLGIPVLPTVVDALCDLDFGSEGGSAQALALLKGVVEPLFRGHPLIGESPTEEALRRAALRTHSLVVLTAGHSTWWTFDLPLLNPHADGPVEVSRELLEPPLFVGQLAAPESRPKFGGRRDLKQHGGSGTEVALAEGLAWLARSQEPDGRWTSGLRGVEGTPDQDFVGRHDQGVTGLALLALLHAGNTLEVGPYRESVVRATTWLVSQQDPDNGSFRTPFTAQADDGQTHIMIDEAKAYDHAIATLAFAHLMRSSESRLIEHVAQRAIDHIVRARNPYGAWRYGELPNGESDTSITSWMLMALIEAEEVGLDIDREALHGCRTWLDDVTDTSNGRVGYDLIGSLSARMKDRNDHFPRDKGEAMTAAGLCGRFALGQDPNVDEILQKHAELLRSTLPEWDRDGYGNDMYYWYYATYAMFQMGGSRFWKPWNEALKPALLNSQVQEGDHKGSWDPIGPWGFVGGRTYATALMCRCLQVYTSGLAPQTQR